MLLLIIRNSNTAHLYQSAFCTDRIYGDSRYRNKHLLILDVS